MSVFATVPPQGPAKPGQLSPQDLHRFFHQGYLIIPNVLTAAELEPMKEEIDGMVATVADRLFQAGKIENRYLEAGHGDRLRLLEAEYPGAAVLVHKLGACGPALQHLWTHPTLLNVMEQLVGPDIVGHPVWNVRPKVPNVSQMEVPWHQDAGYMHESADNVLTITGWIPLLDTNANNGCLQIVPGAHKAGKVGQHRGLWRDTWHIYMSEEAVGELGVSSSEAVTCEVPYGSVLIFTNLTPHGGLPNLSPEIRWSVDLRWLGGKQATGFDDVKAPVWLRRGGRDLQPDWEAFNAVNRQTVVETSSDDSLMETSISPEQWIRRWPLTHTNRHSDAMLRERKARSLA